MRVVKLTAIGLAVIVTSVLLPFGVAVHQLSRLYPDEDKGRRIAETLAVDLAAEFPGEWEADIRSEHPFGEISVESEPRTGDLAESEVAELLDFLAARDHEIEGSGWRLESTIVGRWNRRDAAVHGLDIAQWDRLRPAVDALGSGSGDISLDLERGVVAVAREAGNNYCGNGSSPSPRDFPSVMTRRVADAVDAVPAFGADEGPVFHMTGIACKEGPTLRYSVILQGEDRANRLADLEMLLGTLPAQMLITDLRVKEGNMLEVAVREVDGGELPETETADVGKLLSAGRPHGEIRLNGELLAPAPG